MKLQSSYGLKEKIGDDRRVSLRLQWYHLTRTELKQILSQIEQMTQTAYEGQDMLFLGYVGRKRVKKAEFTLPWKTKECFRMTLHGFVRTDEPMKEQRERIWDNLFMERKHSVPFLGEEQEAERLKNFMCNRELEYIVNTFPIESTFDISWMKCKDNTYRINCILSVSAYAVKYALEDMITFYKSYLCDFYKNTELYAGYIYYETQIKGGHDYYHLLPPLWLTNVNKIKHLIGCEWAAYLSDDLVRKLSVEQLSALEQLADVTKENKGLFYQTKCHITEYGLEQKRAYREIFQPILMPGFHYVPVAELYGNKLQPMDETVYLLQTKWRECSCGAPHYYAGFFYKVKPEETPVRSYFRVLKEIPLKD